MNRKNRINTGFFQFTHPGGEHKAANKIAGTDYYFKEWNYRFKRANEGKPNFYYAANNHLRKYLRSKAEYLKNDELHEGYVDFWGEWEPNSIAKIINKNPVEAEPKYINYPVFVENKEYSLSDNKQVQSIIDVKNSDHNNLCVPDIHIYTNEKVKIYDRLNNSNLQNTDPYIWGDNFYYTCCKQDQTKMLKEGSVILFGTGYKKRQYYEIDTMFVISKIISYDENTIKQTIERFKNSKNPSDRLYYNTVLKYVFVRHDGSIAKLDNEKYQFDIIIGATYDNPYNGMYSCFFCNPSEDTAKPKLRIGSGTDILKRINRIDDRNFNPAINTYGKQVVVNNSKKVHEIWKLITEYAKDSDYCLGVKAELPPILTPYDLPEYIKHLKY